MAVSTSTRRAGPYLGNDSQTQFAFSFKCFDKTDLHVVKTQDDQDKDLVLDRDYTVLLNAEQDNTPGGTIALKAPLKKKEKLTIISNRAYNQTLELTNRGGFYPDVINDAFDHVVILIQQLLEAGKRGIKIAVSSNNDVNTTLPIGKPKQLIGWDDESQGLVNFDPEFITEQWRASITKASREDTLQYLKERGFAPDRLLSDEVSDEVQLQLGRYGVTKDSTLADLVNKFAVAHLKKRGFGENEIFANLITDEVREQLETFGVSASQTLSDVVYGFAQKYLTDRGFKATENLHQVSIEAAKKVLKAFGVSEETPLSQVVGEEAGKYLNQRGFKQDGNIATIVREAVDEHIKSSGAQASGVLMEAIDQSVRTAVTDQAIDPSRIRIPWRNIEDVPEKMSNPDLYFVYKYSISDEVEESTPGCVASSRAVNAVYRIAKEAYDRQLEQASTDQAGIVLLSNEVDLEAEDTAATSLAVKKVYDETKKVGVPVGSIQTFLKNISLPEGYLPCDGSFVTSSEYPDLVDALGTDMLPNLTAWSENAPFVWGIKAYGEIVNEGELNAGALAQQLINKLDKQGGTVGNLTVQENLIVDNEIRVKGKLISESWLEGSHLAVTRGANSWGACQFRQRDRDDHWILEFNPASDVEPRFNFKYVKPGEKTKNVAFPKVEAEREAVAYQSWVNKQLGMKSEVVWEGSATVSKRAFNPPGNKTLFGNELMSLELNLSKNPHGRIVTIDFTTSSGIAITDNDNFVRRVSFFLPPPIEGREETGSWYCQTDICDLNTSSLDAFSRLVSKPATARGERNHLSCLSAGTNSVIFASKTPLVFKRVSIHYWGS
ncbi:tail fiber protein [Basilea psittacipulmonis]|uniref:Phage tail collar domain-containing protein n=1 Tax=Basilea psittacipulmonis DSM 24701 TaxID=1072685 RepID=A0A077DE21_9BURK|nr:tail fiber protein [Basilea psittacipulmonis]AIL33095.1 hypothetical protein IX83_07040 [Basilea psittacipulmonis DSM 24701]